MPIGSLIEFVAGTKAKAQEVNYNFNLFKAFVDSLEVSLADVTNDIAQLETQKANTNGDYRVRFSVADALNNYDAVNLQTLNNRIANTLQIISGLSLTKVGNNTILVSAGSAYDSTYQRVLTLSAEVSKTNTNQAASTTYYVYIIGTAELSTDILISSQSIDPALPTDYIYYRRIGSYTTNSSNQIDGVSDEQISQSGNGDNFINQNADAIGSTLSYKSGKGYSISANGWVAPNSGWLYVVCVSNRYNTAHLTVDGNLVLQCDGTGGDRQEPITTSYNILIGKGQTLATTGGNFRSFTFYPFG